MWFRKKKELAKTLFGPTGLRPPQSSMCKNMTITTKLYIYQQCIHIYIICTESYISCEIVESGAMYSTRLVSPCSTCCKYSQGSRRPVNQQSHLSYNRWDSRYPFRARRRLLLACTIRQIGDVGSSGAEHWNSRPTHTKRRHASTICKSSFCKPHV